MKRFLIVPLIMILSGCEGILDNIYDNTPSDDTFSEGFERGSTENRYTLRLNATSYDEWIFVDLHSRTLQRRPIPHTLSGAWDGQSELVYNHLDGNQFTCLSTTPTDTQSEPEQWDFAIHHFDVRTNNGTVRCLGNGLEGADTWTDNQVIVDMSNMMSYNIGYQRARVNRLLSSWVVMDISNPPPVYTASGETYQLTMPDHTQAQLRLRSYVSSRGTKGFLTIDIVYPL